MGVVRGAVGLPRGQIPSFGKSKSLFWCEYNQAQSLAVLLKPVSPLREVPWGPVPL